MLTPSKLVLEHNLRPRMVRVLGTLILLLSTTSFSAAQQPHSRDNEGRRGPPPEAFTACKALTQGDVCSVKSPRGTLNGICQTARRSEILVCVPENRLKGHRPSQEGQNAEHGQRRMREHTINQSSGISNLYPARIAPITESEFESRVEGEWRVIKANAISIHNTGEFPNPGNPNSITEQNFNIRIPAKPVKTETWTRVKIPGYALNGVSFDPGAGEFYNGDPSLGWQYEALSGAMSLGIDENHAHVQPSGKYHYHGLPTGLMERLDVHASEHSPQIGWAVDGFPIYALYGFKGFNVDGGIHEMTSSYRLKAGTRPAGSGQPGGVYDGTFTADYEYVEATGNLDECNGRVTLTPDFPNGTYAYFLTQDYPFVPRCVMGSTDKQMHGPRRR